MRLINADELKDDGENYIWERSEQFGLIYKSERYVNRTQIDNAETVEAIPIEWIVDWLTRQHIPATHTCDDYYAVEMMLDDWEKENGSY